MQKIWAQLKKYLPYVMPIASFIVLVFLLNKTNPLDVGPAGILLVFALVYIFIASAMYLLLTVVAMILAYFVTVTVHSKKRMYYLSSVLAFAPVFLLALSSIGQLEVKDFVLVLCLVGVACFYIAKRS
jgi:hypothetical protein